MGAEKLGTYILDHDDQSYYIKNGIAQEIEYSSSNNKVMVAGEDKSILLERNHQDYKDFKLSFDELNFDNQKEAINKLKELATEIARIEVNSPKKSSWYKQMNKPKNWDDMSELEQYKEIESYVNNNYDYNKGIPEIRGWKLDNKKTTGEEVIKVRLRREYTMVQTMEDSIISIHTKSRDEIKGKETYKVKPHIHIVIPKNNAWGKNFCYLRRELNKKLVEHSLTSSDNSIQRDSKNYGEYKILKDRLTSFSWIVNKHEKSQYIIKQLNQYKGNENSIKLNNVEEKLNRYLELGGSYDFANKLKINLKEKVDVNINLRPSKSYLKAEQNIKEGNYKEIVHAVKYEAVRGLKISERYKDYAKEVLNKDNPNVKELVTAKAIQGVVKNRGYYLDNNWNKVIDIKKIDMICSKAIGRIEKIEQKKVKNKINTRKYLNQFELRNDLKKAGISNVKEISNLSEVAIVFQSNEKYIKDNLNHHSIAPLTGYDDIKEQIKGFDLDISENWENKIAWKIYKEEGYKEKAKEIIESKIAKAKLINGSYNALKQSYQRLSNKFKEITGNENNLIFRETNNIKEQAKESIILVSRLEDILNDLENINIENLIINKEINDKLNSHIELIPEYKKRLSKFEDKLNNIKLNKEISQIDSMQKELQSREIELTGSYTLQYYEDKIEKANININKFKAEQKKISNKMLVLNRKKKLRELENEINKEINTISTNKEIIKQVKELRNGRESLLKMLYNKKDKLNEKENNINKLLKINKKKSIKRDKDKSR